MKRRENRLISKILIILIMLSSGAINIDQENVSFASNSDIVIEKFNATEGVNDVKFDVYGKDEVNWLDRKPYKFTVYDENGNPVNRVGDEWTGSAIYQADQTVAKTVISGLDNDSWGSDRKTLMLNNGWILTLFKTSTTWEVHRSIDDGNTWSKFYTSPYGLSSDASMISRGTRIYMILGGTTAQKYPLLVWFDADNLSNTGSFPLDANPSCVATSGARISMNAAENKIIASWGAMDTVSPAPFNIKARQGTISDNGDITWEAVEKLTTSSSAEYRWGSHSTVYDGSDNPIVVAEYFVGSQYQIVSFKYNGSQWSTYDSSKGVIPITNYHNRVPNVTYMPSEIASKIDSAYTNGMLITAWYGADGADTTDNIRCKISKDDGSTWIDFGVKNDKITTGNTFAQNNPIISWNEDGEIFITWSGQISAPEYNYQLRQIKRSTNGSWGSAVNLTTKSEYSAECPQVVSNYHKFAEPMVVYKDRESLQSKTIKFRGKWTTGTDVGQYTQPNLIPNTRYKAKLEIKNKINEIAIFYKDVVTLSEKSILAIADASKDVTSNSAKIKITDNNPINTEYRVYVDGNYVDSYGNETEFKSGSWYKLNQGATSAEKAFTIRGLEPGKEYSITCESLNKSGAITEKSVVLKVTTITAMPGIPVIRSYEEYADRIKVVWDKAEYAEYYQVSVDGTVLGNTEALEYEFITSSDKSTHTVSITAKNEKGIASSMPFTIKKKVNTPQKMTMSSEILNNSVKLTWNAVEGVYGYEVFVDGQVIKVGKETDYLHSGINTLTQHSYKVRAFNGSGYGPWSDLMLLMTTNGNVANAAIITAKASDEEVILSWEGVKNGNKVDVKFNGMVFTDIKENFCKIKGLNPNTNYTYDVIISNQYGTSAISTTGAPNITTKTISTPKNIILEESTDNVTLTWDAVTGATGYVVKVNGVVKNAVGTSYTDTEIVPGTRSNYEVAAKDSSEKYSAYSNIYTGERLPTKLDKPVTVYALAVNNAVKLMWTGVTGNKGYEVDVNGIVIDNGDKLVYTHRNLKPLTEYKYSVRAVSDSIGGKWSDEVIIKTLFGAPEKPKNINITSTKYVATIKWDHIEGSSYRIKYVDGATGTVSGPIELGTKNQYVHRKLNPQTEYSYQLESYNAVGKSGWSGDIVHNHLLAQCTQDEAIDLGLTASEVTDFDQYVLKVSYNHKALKIDDLSAYTNEKEVSVGKIAGTDIEIIDLRDGQITFKVHKAVEEGYSWTGVINNIKFIPVIDGGMNISYVVEKTN